ncbi:rhoptry kinase family protein ROP41 [Besnoitia besnoiti]|uniref:Rhoptry kinase family protein ROP41 n=1 Tax=Besnoitia besnoiti TaxID=94643 RepID=A0A2A9MKB2_BESBE|nr:rhoptry kinase family protein ROP41 [Besnoitia besnoiti]PFH36711.1 rhoptry kinase family protein ROP41 [Besnoitia besnoiti]
MIRGGYLGLGGNGIVFEASASRRGRHEVYAVKLLFLDSNFMHDTYRNIMNALAVTRHMEMRICTLLRTSTAEELYLQDGFAVPLHCGRIRGLPDLFYVGSWGAACSFVVLYKKLYCSLADLMSACSYLSNPCRLLLSRQMIEVVYNLHAKGLVHRDLKDSNFLLDGQGNVYLGDFGLSVLNNSKEAIVYTPKLTDPADARTLLKAWDGRRPVFAQVKQEADLWALGMTLYKLWTGVYPFGLSSKHFSKSKDITNYIQQLSEDTSTSSFLRRGQDVWGRPILPEVQRIIQGLLRFDRRERLRLSDIINTSPLFA